VRREKCLNFFFVLVASRLDFALSSSFFITNNSLWLRESFFKSKVMTNEIKVEYNICGI
jgi:hypothetical protein